MLLFDTDQQIEQQAPEATATRKALRDYQDEAIRATLECLSAGSQSALVCLPTGTGKTVLFARLASEWKWGNVLIVAHRVELLDQAADKLASELGYRPPIEQGARGLDADMMWSGGNVVVGSVHTLRNLKRMRKYRESPFGLIIIDEAHHAVAASYRRVMDSCLEYDPSCKIVGVTATPNRNDNAALGIVFQEAPYAMDMRTAVNLGWLVPIRQEYVQLAEDAVDFSGLRMTRNKFGEADFAKEELESILTEENALHAMSRPIIDKTSGGEQALIFNAGVAHAHLMAAVLNRYHAGSAAAVDGKTDPVHRANIVNDFRAGKIQYLLNYGVFTEGFDAPEVRMVVMARPTASISVFTQMLGRGTRPLPGVVDGPTTPLARRDAIAASAKPYMLCLDFVGNSRHKPASVSDVLGGDYDVEVRQLADERIREANGQNQPIDVGEALEDARVDRNLMLDEARRRSIVADNVRYTSTMVDMFGEGAAPVGQNVETTRGGASDAQIGFLVSLGVRYETAAAYGKRQASAVIEAMKQTRCTNKQRNVLSRFGYDPNVGFETAQSIIKALIANNWERPS